MKIGITGNYASGKGTVCSFFEELGAHHIDTDIISREITLPGSKVLDEIISVFGMQFQNSDGTLKRRELGVYVFSDKNQTERLNSIIHPAILQETLKKADSPDSVYVINAPLLFESGFNRYMDTVITVSADTESSIHRGIKRDNLSREEIISRLSRQFSLKEKIALSDYVIENSGDLENTKRQVIEIWNKIIKTNHQ